MFVLHLRKIRINTQKEDPEQSSQESISLLLYNNGCNNVPLLLLTAATKTTFVVQPHTPLLDFLILKFEAR